jgi:hypothetical protein
MDYAPLRQLRTSTALHSGILVGATCISQATARGQFALFRRYLMELNDGLQGRAGANLGGKHRARNQTKVEERGLHAPYHAITSSRRRLATLTTRGDCHANND